MPYTIDVRQLQHLFRPDAVAAVIAKHETTGLRALRRFYPESRRRPWNSPLVPIEEITDITKAQPSVRRGSAGVFLKGRTGAINWFEPQPVKPCDALTAVDFNNLQILAPINRQQVANEKIARMLDAVRLTADGMAAQSITGTVSWPLYSDAGGIIDTVDVYFGDIRAFEVSADWTHANTKLETIIKDLILMEEVLQMAGYSQLRVICGSDIFTALVGKVIALPNDNRLDARLERRTGGENEVRVVTLGGYTVELENGQYWKPDNSLAGGVWQKTVDAKQVVMYGEDAPWTFLWVQVDNFKLGNQALPFGVVPTLSKDGSAMELFGEAKPFPIAPADAILSTDATIPAA